MSRGFWRLCETIRFDPHFRSAGHGKVWVWNSLNLRLLKDLGLDKTFKLLTWIQTPNGIYTETPQRTKDYAD